MYKHLYILILNLISFSSIGQILIGTITDNNKKILPGTNITIKGENKGTSSDNKGKYSMKLKPNRSVVIEVSFIGFGTKNIRIPMLKNKQVYKKNFYTIKFFRYHEIKYSILNLI